MFNSRSLRNVVLLVLAGTASLGGLAFAAEPSDELLGLIPAGSLFAIRLNNFDRTLSQLDAYLTGVSPVPIDAYLAGVSPVPGGLSMVARMLFAQILGSPELKGVNIGGDFAVYAIATPQQMKPTIKVLVRVSDYAEFVNGNPNVGEPDDNGVSILTTNGRALAVVKQAGHYALFAEPDDSVGFNVGTGIETAIDAAEKNIATGQPLWAYVNIQKVDEVYGQVAVAQLENAKTMMADMKVSMEGALAAYEKQKAELDANDPNQTEAIAQLDKQIARTKESIT